MTLHFAFPILTLKSKTKSWATKKFKVLHYPHIKFHLNPIMEATINAPEFSDVGSMCRRQYKKNMYSKILKLDCVQTWVREITIEKVIPK